MSVFHRAESTPSPSSSTTPPGDNSPRYNKSSAHARPSSPSSRSRRPLSPSSLRDVDLTQSSDIQSRSHFPAPPTGHDLMALFPAAAPECGPEARGGPTSGFFQRQERAFFAQAGKEIVRVRVEVDVPSGGVDGDPKSSKPGSRPWLGPGPHQSPMQTPAAAGQLFPHPNSRQPQRGTVPVTQLLPINCHPPPPPQLPPNLPPSISHQPTPPPQDPSQPAPFPPRPDFPRDEDDDSWKKPMPHNERRRAGKHTKRVIVR
ncbi:hypothetical protein Agabi119p4_11404 [Agaricus bisporus var. burnettii]|uniref:Uncharacterized protein n=1 Tax=Agaricus bisporus var. burnettii TaxID=192524 RepID=A0A8H7C172_AGABI|nr:hypothetical protein Agabi119p4_11404 [Agaricus bisporus var. burnettii]